MQFGEVKNSCCLPSYDGFIICLYWMPVDVITLLYLEFAIKVYKLNLSCIAILILRLFFSYLRESLDGTTAADSSRNPNRTKKVMCLFIFSLNAPGCPGPCLVSVDYYFLPCVSDSLSLLLVFFSLFWCVRVYTRENSYFWFHV